MENKDLEELKKTAEVLISHAVNLRDKLEEFINSYKLLRKPEEPSPIKIEDSPILVEKAEEKKTSILNCSDCLNKKLCQQKEYLEGRSVECRFRKTQRKHEKTEKET